MIPVRRQPEYREFDKEVRQPGLRFLKANPRPNSREFAEHEYWRKAHSQLRCVYGGLCAYTSRYIVDVGEGSVDHFHPKSKFPDLAYEWCNYRLARRKVNNYKGDKIGIIDPFLVQSSWVILEFPSCLVRSGIDLDEKTENRVEKSIDMLGLNEESLLRERCDHLMEYVSGKLTLKQLGRCYPFLSKEIGRQRLSKKKLREMFKRPK